MKQKDLSPTGRALWCDKCGVAPLTATNRGIVGISVASNARTSVSDVIWHTTEPVRRAESPTNSTSSPGLRPAHSIRSVSSEALQNQVMVGVI